LEFKEAKTSFDWDTLKEYCVGIANAGGGHLVLGVSDKQGHPVVGTHAFPNVLKVCHDLLDQLNFRTDLHEVIHPDGRVLVFDIPPRPSGTAYDLNGRYLIREQDRLVAMTEDRLRRIFAEGGGGWLKAKSKSGLSSAEVFQLLDVVACHRMLRRQLSTSQSENLRVLADLGLIEEYHDRYDVLRIGALLLANNLTDFPEVGYKSFRVLVYDGVGKTKSRLDQRWNKGYAIGFNDLATLVGTLLPQNEILKDSLRVELKAVPEDALRELIANAMVHQDFSISGTEPRVEIYSNRIEVSNPGEPIIDTVRFVDGDRSRNEHLGVVARKLGLCEQRGSGVDSIISLIEAHQLPAPDFRRHFGRTVAISFFPKPFEEMTSEERVRACYWHCALCFVKGPAMTNSTLRNRFRLSESLITTVSRIIQAAEDAGLIKRADSGGKGKNARYIPAWA